MASSQSEILDRRSFVPLHYQICSMLRREILEGQLPAGAPLATERDLQQRYKVSRSTVRQALETLEREGLVMRERGRGTHVATIPHVEHLPGLRSFTEEMRHLGRNPEGKVLAATQGQPPETVAIALGLGKEEEAMCLHRLMYIDLLPVVVFRSYLPSRLNIRLSADFTGSLYELLEQEYHVPLREAWETIEAGPCPVDAAELLGIHAGMPVLIRHRLTCTDDQIPVEYVEGIYHAQRYKYSLHLYRQARADGTAP